MKETPNKSQFQFQDAMNTMMRNVQENRPLLTTDRNMILRSKLEQILISLPLGLTLV
jgi:hypothetical protein